MQNIAASARRIISIPWLPAFLSAAGFLAYLLAALEIARTRTSFLDEGLYLFKGYLFATGQQIPFADYGVWTNHAILSFLIPGYVQKWFGPGLETGRYFMIFLSLLTLLGLWVFAKRWGNAWWAVGVVWAMALNPAEIKIHTLVISEGTVAALMVWIVYDVTRKGFPPESIVRIVSLADDGTKPAVMFGNRGVSLQHIHNLGSIVDHLPDDPDNILMKAWEPQRGLPGLYKVDVNTGAATVMEYGVLVWLPAASKATSSRSHSSKAASSACSIVS